jgi:hypothetical protein
MVTYGLQAVYREAILTPADLQFWEQDRIKKRAREIVTQRAQGFMTLAFSSIHFRELRDAVARAAEELSTRPDEDLDYFWSARRGVPTYYAPLFLGVRRKSYLRSASLESVGEGLALHLLEDRVRHGDIFALELFCRPLGSTPDLMMYYRSDPSRLALVEAKATEKQELNGVLTEAVTQLLEVFQGWQNHRDLRHTHGFAVATSIFTPGTFVVSVLKTVFTP